jgi:hypothetical protein
MSAMQVLLRHNADVSLSAEALESPEMKAEDNENVFDSRDSGDPSRYTPTLREKKIIKKYYSIFYSHSIMECSHFMPFLTSGCGRINFMQFLTPNERMLSGVAHDGILLKRDSVMAHSK